MSEPDFESLLEKHDKSDMVGFTRKFVDDLEAAMSADIEIEADMDSVSYTHLTLPTICSV